MASGVKNFAGAVTGTGADITVSKVGFRPSCVKLVNVTSGDEAWWFESMADASMYKRVAAGAGALVVVGGVTPRADGFVLGTDADINAAGEIVHFLAWE